jgi:hypothetical protein
MIRELSFPALALALALPAQAASVYLDPAAVAATPGDRLSLSLRGRDFGQTIEGGGVSLGFDPLVLQLESVVVDELTWDFVATPGEVDNASGTLSDLTFSSLAGHSGSFPIAELSFRYLGGDGAISMSESALNPFASNGEPASPPVALVGTHVSPVPLPTAAGLLASALAGLAAAGRRGKP